jgi:3-hydroxyacyl-[acyl-carrier-protein] dehydratase
MTATTATRVAALAERSNPEGMPLEDLDAAGVMACIPHRFPMLLLDRVVGMEAHRRATGIKHVTINEPFFQGHFPGDPIMPGVLIIEAMAQTAAVLVLSTLGPGFGGSRVYFMGIDEARFRRPVRPGCELRLEVEVQRSKLGVWKMQGRGMVNGEVAAEAVFSAKLMLDR